MSLRLKQLLLILAISVGGLTAVLFIGKGPFSTEKEIQLAELTGMLTLALTVAVPVFLKR